MKRVQEVRLSFDLRLRGDSPEECLKLTITAPSTIDTEKASQTITRFVQALSALYIAYGGEGFVLEPNKQKSF